MKRRMRKVTALVLSVGMMLSMTITSGAVTIDEAQKKADELQSQKSAAQAEKDTLAAKLNSIIEQITNIAAGHQYLKELGITTLIHEFDSLLHAVILIILINLRLYKLFLSC